MARQRSNPTITKKVVAQKKKATSKKKSELKKKAVSKKKATRKKAAPGVPRNYRARVRMYRHGLGDCFLLTFPRGRRTKPFHILIDCGALSKDKAHMSRFARLIEKTVKDRQGKARLDVVVATHEHKDHLSGFNQARDIFDRIEIGAVWLGWTEDPSDLDAQRLSRARSLALGGLQKALTSPRVLAAMNTGALSGLTDLMAFSEDDASASVGRRTNADALEYLRVRGEKTGALKYWEPGDDPTALDGVPGVRAFVLGPPRDRKLLLGSEVKVEHKRDDVVYHLAMDNNFGLDALGAATKSNAAFSESSRDAGSDGDQYQPFPNQHAIRRSDSWFSKIAEFVGKSYDNPEDEWRRIDHDWLGSFGQLALKLDNDTNNTCLVLAFEMDPGGDVLLFVGDAQVGNWLSWEGVEFSSQEGTVKAHDLVRRTVFYKVGHHASHNATLKKGGLELMTSDRLVAFVPLDKEVASKQGRKDPDTGKPRGWDMPAGRLYRALKEKTKNRVVISDPAEPVPPEAQAPEIIATDDYIDYYYV